MIAVSNELSNDGSNWQNEFVKLLPEVRKWLGFAFRHLEPEAREESIEEGVVHSLLSYSRLHAEGRAKQANASSLAWYAARAVKRGRPAVGRMNGRDPLSRYAQVGSGFRIQRQNGDWIDKLVQDKRASVSDQVAAKLDVSAWFESLTQRTKQIARDLALGFSTSEVARRHDLSAGRISQLRRALETSWTAFHGERGPAMA